jgi:TRAP-type C4-dicarboxylate transport system substrate-binding protein
MGINKDFFNRLSKEHQDIVVQAEKEAADWVSKKVQDTEQQTISELVSKGMKRVDSDKRAFSEAARPALDNLFKTDWNVTTWNEVNAY